jgi:hypothetical protein
VPLREPRADVVHDSAVGDRRRLESNRLSEPNYDVTLPWNPDAMPEGWEAVRRRYFALDWIRAAATWTAFALFLAALVQLP